MVPYFAIFTFLPTVLEVLGLGEGFAGELALNLFLLAGAVVGVLVMNRIARRRFLAGSFAVLAVLMRFLGVWPWAPTLMILVCFALSAFVTSAAADLESVYPSEIFPPEIRASGVGVAAAISRVGAAIGTFLLPTNAERLGVGPTVLPAPAVLLLGRVVSAARAPETRDLTLVETGRPDA